MHSEGVKLNVVRVEMRNRKQFDEEDDSSVNESDLDLWCFGKLRRTKNVKGTCEIVKKPQTEQKADIFKGKIPTRKSSREESEIDSKMKRKSDETEEEETPSKSDKSNKEIKQQHEKKQQKTEPTGGDEDGERMKLGPLTSNLSINKESRSNGNEVYDLPNTSKDKKINTSKNQKTPEVETQEELTNDEQTKPKRRTLGSLFSIKKEPQSKNNKVNDSSGRSKNNEKEPNRGQSKSKNAEKEPKDAEQAEPRRRTFGSFFSMKKEPRALENEKSDLHSNNIDKEENANRRHIKPDRTSPKESKDSGKTREQMSRRTLGSLFSIKRSQQNKETPTHDSLGTSKPDLDKKLDLKEQQQLRDDTAHPKKSKKGMTLQPKGESEHEKDAQNAGSRAPFGLMPTMEHIENNKPKEIKPTIQNDGNLHGERSSVQKVERFSDEAVARKPFGIISEEPKPLSHIDSSQTSPNQASSSTLDAKLLQKEEEQTLNAREEEVIIAPSEAQMLTAVKLRRLSEPENQVKPSVQQQPETEGDAKSLAMGEEQISIETQAEVPLKKAIKQERLSEPEETKPLEVIDTDTKPLPMDERLVKEEPVKSIGIKPETVKSDKEEAHSLHEEEFSYKLYPDELRVPPIPPHIGPPLDPSIYPITADETHDQAVETMHEKNSFYKLTKTAEYDDGTSNQNLNHATPKADKAYKYTQTDATDEEDDSTIQSSSAQDIGRTLGVQTEPHRFLDYPSSESAPTGAPIGPCLTSTYSQTDCVCNNESSIERMNTIEMLRAARTGSRKQSKAVQTDICMCNYITSSEDSSEDIEN